MIDSKGVRKWLVDVELTHLNIAREAGVSRPCVTNTICGRRTSLAVVGALRFLGCPERFLPTTHEEAA